jgi:hypothetical protein
MKELGELLRAARLQKDVSLDEASSATRIRRQWLGAIEDGDFRVFPGPAYATGMLRNYAVYLGLNPDEILQTYHALTPAAPISMAPATTVGEERLRRRSRRKTSWVFIGLLAFLLAGFGVKKYNDNSHATTTGSPISTSGLVSPQPASRSRINATSGFTVLSPATQKGHRLIHLRAHGTRARVGVHALQNAYLGVKVNGVQVFWGPMTAGMYKTWSGKRIVISTRRGNAFRLHADGKLIGLFSRQPLRVHAVITPTGFKRTG